MIRNWYLFNAFPSNTLNPSIVDSITRNLTREEMLSDDYFYTDHYRANTVSSGVVHPDHIAIFFLMLELTSPLLNTPDEAFKVHNIIKLILDFKVVSDPIISNTIGFRELVKYGWKSGASFTYLPESELICRDICGTIEKRYGHPKGRVRGMSMSSSSAAAVAAAAAVSDKDDADVGESGETSRAAVTPKTPYYTNEEEATEESTAQPAKISPIVEPMQQKQAPILPIQHFISPYRGGVPPPPSDRPPEPHKPPPPPTPPEPFIPFPPSITQAKPVPAVVQVTKNDRGLLSAPLSKPVLGKHGRSDQGNLHFQRQQQPPRQHQQQSQHAAPVNHNRPYDDDDRYNNSKRLKPSEDRRHQEAQPQRVAQNHVSSSSSSSQYQEQLPVVTFKPLSLPSSSDSLQRTGEHISNPNGHSQLVNSGNDRQRGVSQSSMLQSITQSDHHSDNRNNNNRMHEQPPSYTRELPYQQRHDRHHSRQDSRSPPRVVSVPVSSGLASRLGGGRSESSKADESTSARASSSQPELGDNTRQQHVQAQPLSNLGKRKAEETIDYVQAPSLSTQPNDTNMRPNTTSSVFDRLSFRPDPIAVARTSTARSLSQEFTVSSELLKPDGNRFVSRLLHAHLAGGKPRKRVLTGKPVEESIPMPVAVVSTVPAEGITLPEELPLINPEPPAENGRVILVPPDAKDKNKNNRGKRQRKG